MAKGVDFSDILNKRVEDIESPKPLPIGEYIGIIQAPPSDVSFDTTDKETGAPRHVPACRIKVGLMEATDTVDEAALAAAKGLRRNDGKPKEVEITYYLEEENLHKLKKLASTCGISGETLREIFEQLPGKQVKVSVGLRPDRNDPDVFYNQVNKMVGLEG